MVVQSPLELSIDLRCHFLWLKFWQRLSIQRRWHMWLLEICHDRWPYRQSNRDVPGGSSSCAACPHFRGDIMRAWVWGRSVLWQNFLYVLPRPWADPPMASIRLCLDHDEKVRDELQACRVIGVRHIHPSFDSFILASPDIGWWSIQRLCVWDWRCFTDQQTSSKEHCWRQITDYNTLRRRPRFPKVYKKFMENIWADSVFCGVVCCHRVILSVC